MQAPLRDQGNNIPTADAIILREVIPEAAYQEDEDGQLYEEVPSEISPFIANVKAISMNYRCAAQLVRN